MYYHNTRCIDNIITGEEVSIDKQVACEECPRWLKMTEVACEKTEVAVC